MGQLRLLQLLQQVGRYSSRCCTYSFSFLPCPWPRLAMDPLLDLDLTLDLATASALDTSNNTRVTPCTIQQLTQPATLSTTKLATQNTTRFATRSRIKSATPSLTQLWTQPTWKTARIS